VIDGELAEDVPTGTVATSMLWVVPGMVVAVSVVAHVPEVDVSDASGA
jgi:hypothetical protein